LDLVIGPTLVQQAQYCDTEPILGQCLTNILCRLGRYVLYM